MIVLPNANELTQGTIFSCAVAEDYRDVPVWGVVITARCDVSQNKAEIFSYVPVVTFEDWLLNDGVKTLARRCIKKHLGEMKNTVSQVGFAISILDVIDFHEVGEKIRAEGGRGAEKAHNKYLDSLVKYELSRNILSDSVNVEEKRKYLELCKKDYDSLVKDLLGNSVMECYYLSSVEEGEADGHGYVALLREIRFMPAKLAHAIVKGLDLENFKQMCLVDKMLVDKLGIGPPLEFAFPVGLIKSPHTEHFMQRFTQLFARIGVSDYSPERLSKIHQLVPSQK